MKYEEHEPSPAAEPFLACLWTLETDSSQPQRIVPDGRPELIVHLGEPFEACRDGVWSRQPRCFLAGQITRPLLVRAAGRGRVLGARFQPHGAQRVCPFPMSRLTDAVLPLDFHAGGPAELEAALLGQALRVDAVVARYLGGEDPGVSGRTLERRFQAAVGLSPKLYARIQRFQRVFREFESGGKWVDAAIAAGYYDQAHLARDFREFAGEAPRALVGGDELARHFLSNFSKTPRAVSRRIGP